MRYRIHSSSSDNASIGAMIGGTLGIIGATVATVWGGYEIGSAVNNSIHLDSHIGRGLVDLVTMGAVAGPAYAIGFWGGLTSGGISGVILHTLTEKTRNMGNFIVNSYRKLTGNKESSEDKPDRYFS